MASMTLYHGAARKAKPHIGQCWTPELWAAEAYARMAAAPADGHITAIAISLSGLTVEDVAAYDHDSDDAVGDYDEYDGDADIIRYDDEDDSGSEHTTYRLMSRAAVDAVRKAL